MKNKVYQENKCLQAKAAIDYLRTALFEIEDFNHKNYNYWDSKLKSLKKQIDEIYWDL